MPNFIVFTVDHEQQQTFVDFHKASTDLEALSDVLETRPYCCHGAAYRPDHLRRFADDCERGLSGNESSKCNDS